MTTSLAPSSLETLLESAQLLHSSLNLEDLLRHLLRSVMGRLLVTKAFIAVENDDGMRLELVRGLSQLKVGNQYHVELAREAGINLILPIGDATAPTGLLGIVKPTHKQLDDEDIAFIQALLGLAASGIANARAHQQTNRVNQALDQKVQDMQALIDLGRGLTSTFEPEEVARLLVLTLAGRWMVRKYALAAWKKGQPPVLRQKGMSLEKLTDYGVYGYDPEKLADCVRAADLPDGLIKDLIVSEQGEIAFPIKAGDETTGGLVVLGPRPGNLPYSESDLEFGAGLVAQAAVAFENAWFLREVVERKKVEQELALAATIQQNLFPAKLPALANYDLAAWNRPARQCGGDYYDMLQLKQPDGTNKYLICVADVSGKGLPASLLMSNMQATLRALLGRIPSLTDLATHTNELLYATTPSNKYVTAILVELDENSGECRYVNAGHTDCLLMRANGEAEWLQSTGTPFGLMGPDIVELLQPYQECSFTMHPGDILALFSDGVTEAQDVEENEFGETRTADFVRPIATEPAATIVEKVFQELDRYAGAAPQYDDITLLVIKKTA
jgi:sigma-B regulation protein RsbU (phosphoserine phosphatase)